ncbi:MAG: 50S ribosomal protein L1 [Candidatus Moranbacteria bacterium]|nr:50S ribosomal protein L1 [Candidatus Moranbacteria bacterium]
MMKKGKRYESAVETVDKERVYSPSEAFKLVKENAKAKFDESIEVHVRLNIDPKKGEQQIRGTVTLPQGTGKNVKVGVITESKETEAKKAGADVVGGQELIDQMKTGKLPDVDVLVATPDIMAKLAQAARVLGPRGLMPSPKTDTVTVDVEKAVSELKKGKESFKNDNTSNVHQIIGKASFEAEKLEENFKAFINAVRKCKTDAHKGNIIVGVSVCSTMGPAVKIEA